MVRGGYGEGGGGVRGERGCMVGGLYRVAACHASEGVYGEGGGLR